VDAIRAVSAAWAGGGTLAGDDDEGDLSVEGDHVLYGQVVELV